MSKQKSDYQRPQAAVLAARLEGTGKAGSVLVLDEIQKIPAWSETVKRLWDEDTRKKRPLKVVLLGSALLLIARGLTESLAGRFETLRLPLFGPGALVHEDARPAPGRRQCHDTRPLPGPARRRRHGPRP